MAAVASEHGAANALTARRTTNANEHAWRIWRLFRCSCADCSAVLVGRHLVPLEPQLPCAFYDFVAQFHRGHIVVGRNVIVIDQIA